MKATEKATFAAGCFWGVEQKFRQVKGVTNVTVGYTGGRTKNPSYEDVCTDKTGHAEAVEIVFDPKKTTFEKLLSIFWKLHDPTQLNKQGPDIGTQYRSAIFYHSENQRKAVLAAMKLEQKKHETKIQTVIEKAAVFYKAEEYHQQYLSKHGLNVC